MDSSLDFVCCQIGMLVLNICCATLPGMKNVWSKLAAALYYGVASSAVQMANKVGVDRLLDQDAVFHPPTQGRI